MKETTFIYSLEHPEGNIRYIGKSNPNSLLNNTLECPYCHIISRSVGNMKRYHFDNCKLISV